MSQYSLTHLSDAVLLRDFRGILARERGAAAMALAHIAEVDARKLYAPEGYSSMFAYCVEAMRLSEDAAAKRIHAARAARRFPVLFDAVAEGRLHLTAVCLIAPHLTPENVDELIETTTHRRAAEVRDSLAMKFPSDVSTPVSTIRPIAQHALKHVENGSEPGALFAESAGAQPVTSSSNPTLGTNAAEAPREHAAEEHALKHVVPVAASKRFLLQVALDEHTHDRLRYAQALLSHSVSPQDLSRLILQALEALIEKTEKRRLGAPEPRRAPAHKRAARSIARKPARNRYIPTGVRRAVWERDRGQCTFVSAGGHRCAERRFLEFDHVEPLARGGRSTVDGLRLRCRGHNQLEADRTFGAEFMNRKRANRRRALVVERSNELTQDVLAGLRGLGCRGDEAQRAAQFSETIEGGSLEERMRAALTFLSGRSRAVRYASP
ncbi:MAG TPA: hypothetical protein VE326_00190 [Candidatus Binatia bacterium]|nr:hypothetical protein [Candidatus Binatia bacterium]